MLQALYGRWSDCLVACQWVAIHTVYVRNGTIINLFYLPPNIILHAYADVRISKYS